MVAIECAIGDGITRSSAESIVISDGTKGSSTVAAAMIMDLRIGQMKHRIIKGVGVGLAGGDRS